MSAGKKVKHPMQPLVMKNKVVRFKENAIVRFLYDWAASRGMSLNELAVMPFDKDDRSQFAQLIGYSVSGFGELNYVDNKTFKAAAELEAKFINEPRAGRG